MAMSPVCSSCLSPKANLECCLCKSAVCKNCAHFVDENTFSFLPELPIGLEQGAYCVQCNEAKLAPEQSTYEQMIEAAKNIDIYMKNQGKESRLLRRADKPVQVVGCKDRE